MTSLLLAITLILWGLSLLGIVAVSATILGILALVTGILFLVSGFVVLPALPVRRTPQA
jgi:hypothetical protein